MSMTQQKGERPPTHPLSALVGGRVRKLREERGWTQDQLAGHLRMIGLNWPRSTVAKLERGERAVSLEELLLVAMIFDLPIADLVPGTADEIALTPLSSVRAGDLSAFLRGEVTPHIRYLDSPLQREHVPRATEAMRRTMARLEARWPKLSAKDLFAAEAAASGEVETKGAVRIGVEPFDLAIAAQRLYGRSLTAERDARVKDRGVTQTPASLRAVRGHVTRELLEEIKQEITESKRRVRRKR